MNQIDKILSKVGDLNFKRRVLKVVEYLQIDENDKVLDAGCGEGFYVMLFSELYNCFVVGVDSDEKILNQARNWLKDKPGLELKQGNINKLDFPDNYFDKIVCSEVLEHIPDDRGAVKELFRVMKPGGTLAVTVPNKNYPFMWDPLNKIREAMGLGHFNAKSEVFGGVWAYDHKRLYTVLEVEKIMVNAGFKLEKKEVLTRYGVPFYLLFLVLGKRMYTKLPVPKEVESSMEKFKWGQKVETKSIFSFAINMVFSFIKFIDRLNNREFNLGTPTMVISVKATKPR